MNATRCQRVSERMQVAALGGRPGRRWDRRHVARCTVCAGRVSRAAHARMVLGSMAGETDAAPITLLPSVMAHLGSRPSLVRRRVAAVGSAVAVGVATAVATGIVAVRRRNVAHV